MNSRLVFTYFRPARPAQRLDDRKYAAVHAKQTTPTEVVEVADVEALCDWIMSREAGARKGDAGYIVAGKCEGTRMGDCVGPASFALIDYDGAAPDWAALEQYEGFAWSTASHVPGEHEAWRVVIPFTEPVAHGKLECPFEGAHIRNRSQPAFLPTGSDVQWCVLGGTQRLDASELEQTRAKRRAVGGAIVRRALAKPGDFDFDAEPNLSAITACVPPAGQDGERHVLVRALGGWLARRGYTPEAIARAVRNQIPSRDPAERAKQARMAAEQARRGLEAPGWDALERWCSSGWGNASTLPELERATRDPREPEGFAASGECWSTWWARAYGPDGWVTRWASRGRRGPGRPPKALAQANAEARANRRAENAAALAAVAPGLALDTDDDGRPYGTPDNLAQLVNHLLGHALALDVAMGRVFLTEEVRLSSSLGADDVLAAGAWRDEYTVVLQCEMNRGARMRHAYSGDVHNAVSLVAARRPINIHGEWLQGLAERWDGTPRVDEALSTYWKAEDDAVSRATSRIFLLSIAARAFTPGAQVDTVPVLIGTQGCGKSQSLRALMLGAARAELDDLPYEAARRHSASPLQIGHKDAMSNIQGVLVWELAELASMRRADLDATKAFITQCADTFRPSYGRNPVTFKRQTVFVGTVNPDESGHVVVNRDDTGGRRWLPVRVGQVDLAAIERDQEQLLGEAAARVLGGEQHWPTEAEATVLAPAVAEVTEDTTAMHPWASSIATWLKKQKKEFTFADVYLRLGIGEAQQDVKGSRDIGNILRRLRCTSRKSNNIILWSPPRQV